MSGTHPAPIPSYMEEAKTIRALAAQAQRPEIQEQLLRLASMYEKLAHLAKEAPANAPADSAPSTSMNREFFLVTPKAKGDSDSGDP
jgi:hypothetical protein